MLANKRENGDKHELFSLHLVYAVASLETRFDK